MSEREVTTAVQGDPRPAISVMFDFGDNLEEAVEKFGEEVVFSRYQTAVTVDLQGFIRGMMKKVNDKDEFVMSDEQIVEKAKGWTPGVKKSPKSDKDKALEFLGKLSEEDLAEVLRRQGLEAA